MSAADHHQPISDDDETNQQFVCDVSGEGGFNDSAAAGGSDGVTVDDGSDENNVVMQDSVVG